MRRLVLMVLLLAWPASATQAQPVRPTPSAPLITAVLETAMTFIAPRTLQATSLQQLTLWGLRGLTALDPALTLELRDGSLRLIAGKRLVFERPLPAEETAAAWAAAAAALAQAAALESTAVRDAGSAGVLRSFFEELFNHLDPYSRYLPPDAADRGRARRVGEAGAGVQLSRRGTEVVVARVVPDSPAEAAGIRQGDRLIAVDDRLTRGQELNAVSDWLTGDEGTLLVLRVRDRANRLRNVELERQVIAPDTVSSIRVGDALVLRVTAFGRDTDQRLARELARGLAGAGSRVGGIVLDLRGNRGGLLRQAVAAADLVLDGGLVAITAGRHPQASNEWFANEGDVTGGRPLVILVDGRSASAAEIMAAGLADRGRAVVVGSSTLGKGFVQTVAVLPDGGELFVTWSRVLAPGGWPLQGLGVLPQICTSTGQDALDLQVEALLRGEQPFAAALARHRAARAPLPAAQVAELRTPCPAAEGREADMAVARRLLSNPTAYSAALLPVSVQVGLQDLGSR